jgi:hypothetical protein
LFLEVYKPIFVKPIFNGKNEAWNLKVCRNLGIIQSIPTGTQNELHATPSVCWNTQMIHIRNMFVLPFDKTRIAA